MSDRPQLRATAAPLVTVGVPVFNGARYLEQALTSAVEQEYESLEIVVSDNGSTDGTAAICEAFARRDPRVRWSRTGRTTSLIENYRRVLSEARGKYFTWLAADDLLSSRRYVATCAALLEALPDVVLCGTAMNVLDYDWPGSVSTVIMGAIDPERDWSGARLGFFRFPYLDREHFVFYGVYRREALLQVPLVPRRHRGEPMVLDMEYPILARLSLAGRIVAVPEPLRAYRCREDSEGFLAHELRSRLALGWLSFTMKLTVLRIAATSGLPARDRLRAIGVALGNFVASTSRVRPLKDENKMLYRVCRERVELIARLQATADERAKTIAALQEALVARDRRITELEQSLRSH